MPGRDDVAVAHGERSRYVPGRGVDLAKQHAKASARRREVGEPIWSVRHVGQCRGALSVSSHGGGGLSGRSHPRFHLAGPFRRSVPSRGGLSASRGRLLSLRPDVIATGAVEARYGAHFPEESLSTGRFLKESAPKCAYSLENRDPAGNNAQRRTPVRFLHRAAP